MSTTTLRAVNLREVVEDPVPANHNNNSSSTTRKKRASLALSALFANQSRPAPVPTTTTTRRSEPFATTRVEPLDSSAIREGTSTRRSSTSGIAHTSTKPTRAPKVSLGLPPRFRKLRRSSLQNKSSHSKKMMDLGSGPPENVLQWLEAACPKDVVPRVLAFCGPQTTQTLMATNRYWFQLIALNDTTWRTLCEGMYKWIEGRDETPTSWKDYYRLHPCVPTDYPSIPRALTVATVCKTSTGWTRSSSANNAKKDHQVRSVEVLLRPGKHFIKESLVVQANEDVSVTLKTMELPKGRHYSPRFAYAEQEHPQSFPESTKSKSRRNSTLKQWMGCKSAHGVAASVEAGSSMDAPDPSLNGPSIYDSDSSEHSQTRERSLSTGDAARIHMLAASALMPPPQYPTRATLVLRTRRMNEPVVRVKQGHFHLEGVDVQHASQGVDIWNGNACVQIQPPLGPDNEPLQVVPKPTANLVNVAISSKSGRGVVCLDGGQVDVKDCMIYDCAATGLYVGGPGSQADIQQTDVIRNGIGSRLPPSRMPRVTSGHSGVYLEQGLAKISECNISSNYLTGISAVSFEKAFLHLSKTDLVANGQGNLEVPPPGTLSYDKSEIANDNNMASVGRPCLRSNLELPARARARASF